MIVSMIAAMASNRVIGQEGQLPWNIPEDLRYFRDTTAHHPLVMGRKTFESLGRPLPKRPNIVITRNRSWVPACGSAKNLLVVSTLEEALAPYQHLDLEVFIAGGGEIYSLALPVADRLYLTEIHQEYSGDARFPEFDRNEFKIASRRDVSEPVPHSYLIYERAR